MVKDLLHLIGLQLLQTCSKHHTLTLLDVKLEVTRYIQVFLVLIPQFLFLLVFDTTIPCRLKHELILLVELHHQFWITRIHASLDAVVNQIILSAGTCILMRTFLHATESEERT